MHARISYWRLSVPVGAGGFAAQERHVQGPEGAGQGGAQEGPPITPERALGKYYLPTELVLFHSNFFQKLLLKRL